MGDILAPYLTPFWFVIGAYYSLFITYTDSSLLQIYSKSWMISFGTYSPINYQNRSTCLTESKAFLRSMNIATHGEFILLCISKISYRLLIYSTVDLSGVKPCYYNQSDPLSSKCQVSLSCSHRSSMLSIICLSVIGLQLPGCDLSSSLNRRITFDSLSSFIFLVSFLIISI